MEILREEWGLGDDVVEQEDGENDMDSIIANVYIILLLLYLRGRAGNAGIPLQHLIPPNCRLLPPASID